jgi:transcriptional regulator with XRE-family HTH domain
VVEGDQISGEKFLQLRKDLRLTQEELSRAIEMSTANVRRVEGAAVTTIRPSSFRRLATLVGVPAEALAARLAPSAGSTPSPATLEVMAAIARDAGLTPDDVIGFFERQRDLLVRASAGLTIIQAKQNAPGIRAEGEKRQPRTAAFDVGQRGQLPRAGADEKPGPPPRRGKGGGRG